MQHQADYEGLVRARLDIANYHGNKGNHDVALASYFDLEKLQRQTGTMRFLGYTLLMIGVVYRKRGMYEQAITYLQQAFQQGEARQHRGDTATSAHHLAWVYLNLGDLSRAHSFCDKSLVLYEKIGNRRGIADAYEQLGCIMQAEGRMQEALDHFHRSLQSRRQAGSQHGVATSLRRLAVAYFKLRHVGTAMQYLYQAYSSIAV